MRLVDEIIDEATNPTVPLTTLLRKALVLGSTLKNDALKSWAQLELNGYKGTSGVPDYRSTKIQAKGDFQSYTAIIRGQPIPAFVMEEDHRFWATSRDLTQGVAAYEGLLTSDQNPQIAWPADLVVYYQERFIEGAVLMRAWQEIPRSAIVDLVDSVRNRLLLLALDLRDDVQISEPSSAPAERVQEAVVHNIFGGNVVIASSIAGDVRQTGTKTIVKGDVASLRAALKGAGVSDDHIGTLEVAIDGDAQEGSAGGLGRRVSGWLKERGESLGDGVAAGVISQYVLRYLGIM